MLTTWLATIAFLTASGGGIAPPDLPCMPECVVARAPASGAQEASDEPLVTDRPDATESTETVAPRRFQVESGYTFSSADAVDAHSLGEVLVRVGLLERVELRFGVNSYLWQRAPSTDLEGFEDASFGAKVKLVDSGGVGDARPAVAVILSTSLPTGSSVFRETDLQPELRLAAAWDLTETLSLGSNVAYAYLDDSAVGERFHQLASTVALGIVLTDRVGAYIEHFGSYPAANDGSDENFVDGGFTFLLTPDAQLDARVGWGLNGVDDEFFVGLGSAFRW